MLDNLDNMKDGCESPDKCVPERCDPYPDRQLTFGEKLVGLDFNPSNSDKVSRAKRLCADLADLLYEDGRNSETSELKNILEKQAYGEILNAQMNVVKVLTLKY